jgi:hypothetical protein
VARFGDEDVHIEPGEARVERKVAPARRNRSTLLGLIVLLAFVATCGVVFFGDRLGIGETGPRTVAELVPN